MGFGVLGFWGFGVSGGFGGLGGFLMFRGLCFFLGFGFVGVWSCWGVLVFWRVLAFLCLGISWGLGSLVFAFCFCFGFWVFSVTGVSWVLGGFLGFVGGFGGLLMFWWLFVFWCLLELFVYYLFIIIFFFFGGGVVVFVVFFSVLGLGYLGVWVLWFRAFAFLGVWVLLGSCFFLQILGLFSFFVGGGRFFFFFFAFGFLFIFIFVFVCVCVLGFGGLGFAGVGGFGVPALIARSRQVSGQRLPPSTVSLESPPPMPSFNALDHKVYVFQVYLEWKTTMLSAYKQNPNKLAPLFWERPR